MRIQNLLRAPTFRLTMYCAIGFAVFTLMLFAFIFWQTADIETKRVDHSLERDAEVIAKETPAHARQSVARRVAADFHRIVYASIFDPDGNLLVGNLKLFPRDLPLDGLAHRTQVDLLENFSLDLQNGRVVGRRMPDGRLLVIGRNVDSLEDLEQVVLRAFRLGILPAFVLSLVVGAALSLRAQRQIQKIHAQAERIARGEIWERLPTRDGDDNFNLLAGNVNKMLDGIGDLLQEVNSSNANIAHDLRTPLTRVRIHLDRARDAPLSSEELQGMVGRAIDGLDHALRIISALRRIAQIEGRQRRVGFAEVDMAAIVQEVAEFYEPLAEEKAISFRVVTVPVPTLQGDHDLLIEAIGNLVDNALKYTPDHGCVQLLLSCPQGWPLVRVEDDGPGIAPQDRQAVLKRFYRGERTRHIQGSGLGLSLVDAIARLHGFAITIGDTDRGCAFELSCRPQLKTKN